MVVQFNIVGGCQLIMTPYIVNQYDEKHIFRYKTLDRLYSAIYERLHIKYTESKKVFVNRLLVVYPDERQAEVLNSWRLPIKERVKIHIKVLRFEKTWQNPHSTSYFFMLCTNIYSNIV